MKTIILNLNIIIIALLCAFQLGNAKTIQGKVYGLDEKNEKKPLAGASIKSLNSNFGTITNSKGEFTLNIPTKDTFVVSFVGYKKDTIQVGPDIEFLEILLTGEIKSNEVLVEGKKEDFYIEQSKTIKTEVLSENSLKKAACCNLSESFITNPTVDVTYTDAITGIKQIQLLGLAQSYTQILTENSPNLQGFASNYGLLFIPGPWINSISISKGTSSVTQGYESITGQINIGLKEPSSTDRIYVNLFGNDLMRFETNLITKASLGEKTTAIAFGNAVYSKKYIEHNGDGFLDSPFIQMINLLSRVEYKGGNYESRTFIHWLADENESGQVSYFRNPDNSNFWGSKISIRRLNLITKNGFFLDNAKNSSIGTILNFTHHSQKSKFGNRNLNLEQNSVFLNILWTSRINPFHLFYDPDESLSENPNLTTGLSFSYNNYLQYLDSVNLSTNEVVPGIFAELTFEPLDKITIIPGLRVDFHNKAGTLLTPRIHIKYSIDELNTIRFSAGKGYHFPLPIVENQSILNSSRTILFDEELKIEEAWNFGLNSTHSFELWGIYGTLNLEYYHTDFVNQVIVDKDIDPLSIRIYNLKGKSFSNSFQIDMTLNLPNNIDLLLAYRLNDVWMTTNNTLQRKPLISPHKVLFNLAYKPEPFWFDFTIDFNGGGRIPNTSTNPDMYKLPQTFKPFVILYANITYRLPFLEIYFGAENITNFKQNNPILAFDKPFSKYFDSSIIWGPIDGRKVYLGIRFFK